MREKDDYGSLALKAQNSLAWELTAISELLAANVRRSSNMMQAYNIFFQDLHLQRETIL